MFNLLQTLKMATQAMKTLILGSATAENESSVNCTRFLEFFKLSLFWLIYTETTNIQW